MRGGHSLENAPEGRMRETRQPLALLTEEDWLGFGLETPYIGAPVLDSSDEAIGAIACYGAPKRLNDESMRLFCLMSDLLAPWLPASAASREKGQEGRSRETDMAVWAAEEKIRQLRGSFLETILSLAIAAEWKGQDSRRHPKRVAEFSAAIAAKLGLDSDRIETLRLAAVMHDVGKGALNEGVQDRTGDFTEADRNEMRRHSVAGERMLRDHENEILALAASIAKSHHERWDGSGYPEGLKGEQIPLESRIVAVADVFDALTSARTYRPPFPNAEAFEIVRSGAGKRFCPKVVKAFVACRRQIESIQSVINSRDEPEE